MLIFCYICGRPKPQSRIAMTILDYQDELLRRCPCTDGLDEFKKCKSRKDFFELVGRPVACDYFLTSIKDGWGPNPQEFEALFRPYINGSLTIRFNVGERVMSSQVWCNVGEISVDSSIRWLILIGCRGRVKISNWHVVKVFVDKYSDVELDCGRNSIVYVENYGGRVSDVKGNCKFKVL